MNARQLLAASVTVIPLMLGACTVAQPSANEQAAADYGPFPDNYKAVIQAYLDDHLKDPESARIAYLSVPQKDYRVTNYSKLMYGYALCITVNAKNSFGGYSGKTLTLVQIRDGKVAVYWEAGKEYDYAVKKACPRLIASAPAPQAADTPPTQ